MTEIQLLALIGSYLRDLRERDYSWYLESRKALREFLVWSAEEKLVPPKVFYLHGEDDPIPDSES